MAIEGPLRELGVHDVFQLLDLSRKTGHLRVRSSLRDNDGIVQFLNGRVVGARMRQESLPLGQVLLQAGRITPAELARAQAVQAQAGEPRRLGDILVAIGAISQRELEKHERRQVETVVFELLSWSEGFFSFAEGAPDAGAVPFEAGLTAESLLMEAARRIDEWARMADLLPGPEAVPALSDTTDAQAAALDLRPHEWQVLAAIDGTTSVRAIAGLTGIGEFDAARVVYGLLSTGVVRLVTVPVASTEDALVHVSDAREANRDGRPADALAAAERALQQAPEIAEAHALAGLACFELGRLDEAERRLRRALELERDEPGWMMVAARLAIRRGDLAAATRLWKRIMAVSPRSALAVQAGEALEHATRLHVLAGVSDGA